MRLALACLLLLPTTFLAAQTQAPYSVPAYHPPTTLNVLWPLGSSCPVGMKAEREASGQREWIVSLEDSPMLQRPDARANNAGVHVQLVAIRGKEMKQAEVAVYYMAPGLRSMLVDQAAVPTSDLKKTFVLSSPEGTSKLDLAGSLLVRNAASITRVQLMSIQYSDGSTWQANAASRCTVDPGLLMAVSSH